MSIDSAPPLDKGFVRALLGDDELRVVVRSHIFVEANINEYLDVVASEPEHISEAGLRYGQRVALACALGFDARFKEALMELGKIRNAFSRKLDTTLSDETVNRLFEKLPAFGKQAVHLSHEHMKELVEYRDKRRLTFEELEPKNKFVLIVLSLVRVVMAAVLLVRSAESRRA